MNKTILILTFLVGRYKFKINSIAKITKSTRLKYIFLDGQLATRSPKSESQLVTKKRLRRVDRVSSWLVT